MGKRGTDWPLWSKYMSLRSNLVSEFRSHHDSRKRNSSVEEFENLTGAEFETYLAVGSGNSELLIPEILSRSTLEGKTCSKFR